MALNMFSTENVNIGMSYFRISIPRLGEALGCVRFPAAEVEGILIAEQLGVRKKARMMLNLSRRDGDNRPLPVKFPPMTTCSS